MSPRSFLFSRHQPTSPLKDDVKQNNKNQPLFKSTTVKTKIDTKNYDKTEPAISKTHQYKSEMAVSILATDPIRPSSAPLVIPIKSQYKVDSKHTVMLDENANRHNPKTHPHRHVSPRVQHIHSPDAISPTVAALLAMTAIPQRRRNLARKTALPSQRLTVDAILMHTKSQESEYSLSMSKSPMEILLDTSDDDGDLDTLGSDPENESYLSLRSMSTESMPSLIESSMHDSSISLPSLLTPSSGGRQTPSRRRRILSISSPTRENTLEHPLSDNEDMDIDSLDFNVFDTDTGLAQKEDLIVMNTTPRRSVFKSNLTASLKALKAAAKSFSSMTTPMLSADDFLTRSIVAIDPRIPFTDERMPPRLHDDPTPALRRYLNPTTHRTPESQTLKGAKCTASIQMQTYKVHEDSKSCARKVPNRDSSCASMSVEPLPEATIIPLVRQREMRENSDFIRIAVMEMLMRKNGKLDDKVPGHAKWALPPRQTSTQAYQFTAAGVPVRWIAMTA